MTNGIFNAIKLPTEVWGASAMRRAAHIVECLSINPKARSPVSDAKGFATYRDMPSSGPIAGLSFNRGPMAVGRLIVTIVVNSVNRVKRGWLTPHVRQKGLEIVNPAVTNLDTAPAISRVFRIGGVEAAPLERSPSLKFKAGALAVKVCALQAICLKSTLAGLGLQASAAKLCLTKVCTGAYGQLAAITATFPHGIMRAGSGNSTKNSKAPKTLTRKVKKFSHDASFVSPQNTYAHMGM